MTTAPVSGGAGRSPRTKGITVTVRLFPEVHGAVLEALARVPCGSRSARVIHLLTIGLMCEQAMGRERGSPAFISTFGPTGVTEGATGKLRGDDLAFVEALMQGAEPSRSEDTIGAVINVNK